MHLNLSNLSCLLLLTSLTTELHAKMEPERLIAVDKTNTALIFLYKEESEQEEE